MSKNTEVGLVAYLLRDCKGRLVGAWGWKLPTGEWENLIHRDEIERYREFLSKACGSETPLKLRYRIKLDNEYVHVDEEVIPVSIGEERFILSRIASPERKEVLKNTLECQRIMNSILELALQDKPLNDILQEILDKLLETPWLPENSKGIIFTVDENKDKLRIVAQKNMPEYVLEECSELEKGRCICGKVAQNGEPIFVSHVDDRHEIKFPGMIDHGHYSLPIISEGKVIGVLCLYLEAGHIYSPHEASFLEAVCKTIANIIKHKTYEEKLENLSIAIEQTPDWVVIADRSGRIEYVNKAVEEITGFSKEEIVGKTPRIWKSGIHNIKFFENLWKTILSGKPYRSVFINRRKDGEVFYLDQTITPVKDSSGKIVRFISTGKDITESKLYEDRIYRLAYYDTLTGLPNRNFFMEKLSEAVNRATGTFGVAIIDIDRLKFVNETYSPQVGDEILKEIARRLSGLINRQSTAARLGSDEFALIIALDSEELITLFVERLLEEISRPIKINGEEVIITASIGLSVYPEDGKDSLTLMKNAEFALSRAKDTGRNTYQFYVSDMNTRAVEFMLLSKHLMNALDKEEFLIFLQPYVDSEGSNVSGAEALLRWKSMDLGIVSPGKFIPILEETGLINRVGDIIVHKVCNLLEDMDIDVSINVSPIQLMSKDFTDRLIAIVRDFGTEPSRITLEITENVFVRDEKEALRLLSSLKDFGFKLAIDDFGTGYSSLNYLRMFPLDSVKIDISYVRDIPYDAKDRAIVKTIIDMAHALGMKTIAEGVEQREQFEILKEFGCDMYQGFLFYRPMEPEELIKVI